MMKIIKFGGTSVGSSENLKKVAAILLDKKENFVVVVSAFSDVTNNLESLASESLEKYPSPLFEELKTRHYTMMEELISNATIKKLVEEALDSLFQELNDLCLGVNTLGELSSRSLAKFLAMGERCSSMIIHAFLNDLMPIDYLDSWELIKAEGDYLEGDINQEKTYANFQKAIDSNKNYICPGFLASNDLGERILLGRGGSDFTATLIGAALAVPIVEIWSDVDGMLQADPRIINDVKVIKQLSYSEAMELSHFGAKVLHARSVRPAKETNVPILLKNTFHPEAEGTLISSDTDEENGSIKGISSLSGMSLLNFSGTILSGKKGISKRFFGALEYVNIILISQSSSEQDICIAIKTEDVKRAKKDIETEFEKEIFRHSINPVEVQDELAVVALVGDRMKHSYGLSGKALSALGENGINVSAIAQGSTERNISIVVEEKHKYKAINVLHERFFKESIKQIHLFVAGIGNVGKEFLKIIKDRYQELLAHHHLQIKLIGVANSKGYYIEPHGIDLNAIQDLAQKIQPKSLGEFRKEAASLNFRNSFFIDNTASDEVSTAYKGFLESSFNVVACNKIASSSAYSNYRDLLQTAKKYNVQFRYETCVGAALPIIKTIQHLVLSGDEVEKIQAVLSGSLNFIFNKYDGSRTFADVVRDAKEEGYTEPNPLIDLSGVDVMRKILILARESGAKMEMEHIENINFLPEKCLKTNTIDELFQTLEEEENYFKKLYDAAQTKNHRLKVVATYENGKAFVSLEEIPPESPIYHLEGKDNIVSINSKRYPLEPMVIKGAGAGAVVTASGVFSDMLLIVNK